MGTKQPPSTRLLRENDVLYLMVVNMPTEEEEEELVKAKTREIARSKGEKRAASRKEQAWFFMIDIYSP